MTIGLCTMSKMPPSTPEVLRVLNHRCDYGEKIVLGESK